MSQGEEEGPERDMVEPTGSRQMGTEVLLVPCRRKVMVRPDTHT